MPKIHARPRWEHKPPAVYFEVRFADGTQYVAEGDVAEEEFAALRLLDVNEAYIQRGVEEECDGDT